MVAARKKAVILGALLLLTLSVPPAAGGAQSDPPVALTAKTPQQQARMVRVEVEVSASRRIDPLRLSGTIRVGGRVTRFTPRSRLHLRAGAERTFELTVDSPAQRETVRRALKRGKLLTARVRAAFHPDEGGRVIVKKATVALVYGSTERT
jgi:hypothetical protein